MARRKNSKTPSWLRVQQARQVWFYLEPNNKNPDGKWLLLGYKIVMQNGDSYFYSKMHNSWSAEINGAKESIGSDTAMLNRFQSCQRLVNQLLRCRKLASSRKTQIK